MFDLCVRIGVEPEELRKEILKAEVSINTGSVVDVVWDKYRERYYVMIRGSAPEKGHGNIIIQAFDKDFNFYKEIIIYTSNTQFSARGAMAVEDGLLLFYANHENKDIKDHSVVYWLFDITFSLAFWGCAQHSQRQKGAVLKYVVENFDVDMQRDNCVFVISEAGCGGCNRDLSRFASGFVDRPGVYFVLNATGLSVDISPYWEAESQDWVSTDSLRYFNGISMAHSYAIFIRENRVDTIMESTADRIYEIEEFVVQRLAEDR